VKVKLVVDVQEEYTSPADKIGREERTGEERNGSNEVVMM
jgi:hypothetical protein